MATATTAPATGKNSGAPMCPTSTPETATDSGKLPNAHSMIALITRPSSAGGAHFCNAARTTTLPSPFVAPLTKSIAAAPASPRNGVSAIAADSIRKTAPARTAGLRSPPERAADSVPITPPAAKQASSAP
jgi:hypothetical protein